MKTRILGRNGLQTSALGLGCMSMTSDVYGPAPDRGQMAQLVRKAAHLAGSPCSTPPRPTAPS